MNSSKRENLLNLALDATEEERLQSLNLNVFMMYIALQTKKKSYRVTG